MHRGLFLDRDGILNLSHVRNGRPYAPRSIEEFVLYEDLAATLFCLSNHNVKIIVVTNQPDISTGLQTIQGVDEMHAFMRNSFPIDAIIVCPHTAEDQCSCRKPSPGMLISSAKEWNINLSESVMVGDRWRDIDAGKAVGCYTIFVDHGYKEKQPVGMDAVASTPLDALKEAQSVLLA